MNPCIEVLKQIIGDYKEFERDPSPSELQYFRAKMVGHLDEASRIIEESEVV